MRHSMSSSRSKPCRHRLLQVSNSHRLSAADNTSASHNNELGIYCNYKHDNTQSLSVQTSQTVAYVGHASSHKRKCDVVLHNSLPAALDNKGHHGVSQTHCTHNIRLHTRTTPSGCTKHHLSHEEGYQQTNCCQYVYTAHHYNSLYCTHSTTVAYAKYYLSITHLHCVHAVHHYLQQLLIHYTATSTM